MGLAPDLAEAPGPVPAVERLVGGHSADATACRRFPRPGETATCGSPRLRTWRPGPVQLQAVNQVRAGRQQPSADPAVCRRSPGRHLRGRGGTEHLEGCESGRIGTLGKRVWGNPPWVRIPPSPPSMACARPFDAMLGGMPRIAVPDGADPLVHLWTGLAPRRVARPAGALSDAVYRRSTLPLREFEAARISHRRDQRLHHLPDLAHPLAKDVPDRGRPPRRGRTARPGVLAPQGTAVSSAIG